MSGLNFFATSRAKRRMTDLGTSAPRYQRMVCGFNLESEFDLILIFYCDARRPDMMIIQSYLIAKKGLLHVALWDNTRVIGKRPARWPTRASAEWSLG